MTQVDADSGCGDVGPGQAGVGVRPTAQHAVVVVCAPAQAALASTRGLLEARGLAEARRYAPRDIDEVERAIRAGEVGRVVFVRADDFLELLWSGELAPAVWLSRGVETQFAAEATADGRCGATALLQAWTAHVARRRRARIIAGVLLSCAALAAACGVLLLAR